MSNKLLSKPSLIGLMRESANYQFMGTGLTDTVLLVGHADAAVMYEPYQVIDIKSAVTFLRADISSPLLKALLECYNAGCKDIWLYAAAPMSEYEALISNRFTNNYLPVDVVYPSSNLYPGIELFSVGATNFYEKWFERLGNAYNRLSDWDFMEIVVPLEAVYYDAGGVDFAKQIINFCSDVFATTGNVMLGVLGTRIASPSPATTVAMATDTRLPTLTADGKFVMVAVGEGIINNPQISNSYVAPLATQVAAVLATASMNRSITGLKMPNCSSLTGPNYSDADLDLLTQAKLNPLVRSQKGKRGYSFETKLLTDNTLGQDGTDFWAMGQMHIVANCINQVRNLGYSFIGETKTNQFKKVVDDYLRKLKDNDYIKDYSLRIEVTNLGSTATATIGITPIFGIRNIYFTTEVGPGI